MEKSWLIVPTVLFLAACGNSEEPGEVIDTTSSVEESVVVDSASEVSSVEESTDVSVEGEVGPLLERYAKQMAEKKYYMEMTSTTVYDGQEMVSKLAYAKDGDVVAVKNLSPSPELGETYSVFKDEQLYTVDHETKTIIIIPLITTEDTDFDDPLPFQQIELVDSGTENGLKYETYQQEGMTYRYYFSGDQMVKIVMEGDGIVSTTEVTDFSNKPPKAMFDIPADYTIESLDFGDLDDLEGIDGVELPDFSDEEE